MKIGRLSLLAGPVLNPGVEYNELPVSPTGAGQNWEKVPSHDPKSIIHYKNIRAKRLE